MIALFVLGIPIAVCVVARRTGASRWLAVLIALVPAAALTALTTGLGLIMRSPSGERISNTESGLKVVAFQLVLLSLVAWLVKKPNPPVEPRTSVASVPPP